MATKEISTDQRFEWWYRDIFTYLEKTKEIPLGNGAIVALMMALPLYERYLTVELHKDPTYAAADKSLQSEKRFKLIAKDLNLSEPQAKLFWNVFRDGLCHTGSFYEVSGQSAKKGWTLPQVGLNADYPDLPKFDKADDGTDAIFINPWGFAKHVFKKYDADSNLKLYADAPLITLKYEI